MLDQQKAQENLPVPSRHSEFHIALNEGEGWYVPGSRPRRRIALRARALLSTMRARGPLSSRCPFCHVEMRGCDVPESDPETYDEGKGELIGFGLQVCPRCAHWRFWSANHVCMDPPRYVAATSVAGRFSPELPDGCAVEIARALRQHPDRWCMATPNGLERFVSEVFRANYAPCEVRHVGGTADGGVDVVLVLGSGLRTLIQVKRRASCLKREPVSTVRELLGSMVLCDGRMGMVVSTAAGFTRPSWEAVGEARQRGFLIELIDRGALDEMLGPLLPRRPWRELFARPDLVPAIREIHPLVEAVLQPDQLTLFE